MYDRSRDYFQIIHQLGSTYFNVNRLWLREASFKEEVERTWSSHDSHDSQTKRLAKKNRRSTEAPYGAMKAHLGREKEQGTRGSNTAKAT